MKNFLTASVAALALLLMSGTGVHADPLPPGSVSWTYNFSPGAPAVFADSNPSAGVTFTNEPTKTAIGSSNIAAANLSTFSVASAGSPDVLATNGAYSLNLTIGTTDGTGLHTATLTFNGKLTGTFSADSSNITNLFGANASQNVILGAYTFAVSLISYTPPGPPGQAQVGAIGAHVDISHVTSSGGDAPEPGTMLLSGLGLSFLGGAAWRKRRQARVNVAV